MLGDNPLFGIDHLSQEKARDRIYRLDGLEGVVQLIEYATNLGVKGFVVSTHPSLPDLIEYLKKNTSVIEKMNFYPIIPYAQGYVTKVTEKGIMGALSDILMGGSIKNAAQIIGRGAVGFMKKDFQELFKLFIDIELRPLDKVNTKIVFLHDVVTDLVLGLGAKDILESFVSQIKDRYNLEAGLVTKNFPRLVHRLKEWNIPLPPIMTSFNKIGSQMNPTADDCQKCLEENNVDVIAMNTLAGGYLKPADAFEYIFKFPQIKSVVAGVSSKKHADETFAILNKHFSIAY